MCGIPKKKDKFNLTKFQCKNFKGYIFGKHQEEFSKNLKNKLTIKKFKNLKDTLNQIFLEIKNNKREVLVIPIFSMLMFASLLSRFLIEAWA